MLDVDGWKQCEEHTQDKSTTAVQSTRNSVPTIYLSNTGADWKHGFHAPTQLSEAERNPLTKEPIQRLGKLKARATELGRDPDMHHNVRTDRLHAPQAKHETKNLGFRRTSTKKKMHNLHTQSLYISFLEDELAPRLIRGVLDVDGWKQQCTAKNIHTRKIRVQ